MIAALADASRVLREPRYLAEASKAADFLLRRLRAEDGKLLHSFKGRPGPVQRLSRRLCEPHRRPDAAIRGDR